MAGVVTSGSGAVVRREAVLCSACLLGLETRYDGASKSDHRVLSLVRDVEDSAVVLVPVCPEQLGGLPTPRKPATIDGVESGAGVLDGVCRVVTTQGGDDVTRQYSSGAEMVLRIARATGAKRAILKQRSPSCGTGTTNVRGSPAPGDGVTAALLRRNGIQVLSEDDLK